VGQGHGPVLMSIADVDVAAAARRREGGKATHPAGPDDQDRTVVERAGPFLDEVEGDIGQRPVGATEPGVGLAAGVERCLEEPVEDRL
jgi:hypothetical protein